MKYRIWARNYDGYTIRLVPQRVLGDGYAGLHRLTTRGRKIGIPENEIWLSEELEEVAPILALHEAIEHELRRKGWRYQESHEEAMRAEREAFEGTPLWDRALELLSDR